MLLVVFDRMVNVNTGNVHGLVSFLKLVLDSLNNEFVVSNVQNPYIDITSVGDEFSLVEVDKYILSLGSGHTPYEKLQDIAIAVPRKTSAKHNFQHYILRPCVRERLRSEIQIALNLIYSNFPEIGDKNVY